MAFQNLIFSAAIAIFCCSGATHACPSILNNNPSTFAPEGTNLCNLQVRYQAALVKLESKGLQPAERIAGLISARMINRPTWLRVSAEKEFNPWLVYPPVPQTWQSWEDGARILDQRIHQNRQSGKIQPFSLEILKDLHAATLNGLLSSAGKIRTHGEVGMQLSKISALTQSQTQAVSQSEYPSSLGKKSRLLSWTPTLCLEDQPVEVQEQHVAYLKENNELNMELWPAIGAQDYFTHSDGTQKQCGYLTYADPNEISTQLDQWLGFFNQRLEEWNEDKSGMDPLLVAARVQRWFVTIHPFLDGNGRLSRFAMEYVLRSLGLPTPILSDFNNDLYLTEPEWAQEIGRGILQAVQHAEACAENPFFQSCRIILEK